MEINNKYIFGIIIYFVASIVSANGDTNNPPSCIYPCSVAPVVTCATCPENETNDSEILDFQKTVIETYRDFGEQVRDTYQSAINTINTVASILGWFFVVITGVLGFFGFTDYRKLKNKNRQMLNGLREEKEETENQKIKLNEHIEEAKKDMLGMMMDFMAYQKLSEIPVISDKIKGTKDEGIIKELEQKKESVFGEVIFRLKTVDEIDPKDLTVKAWKSALKGTLLQIKDDLPGALQQYDESLKFIADDPYEYATVSGSVYYNKACVLATQGHLSEAKTQLRLAINKMAFLAFEARNEPDFAKLYEDQEFKIITGQEF